MGNGWSGTGRQQRSSRVRYSVVLPTSCRSWELLYAGDISTWDAVAARYGMHKYAYNCGLTNCDRESVCLRYLKAIFKPDSQKIIIERYKSPTVQILLSTCRELASLLSAGYQLNQVAAAQRNEMIVLVLHQTKEFVNQVAFAIIHLGTSDDWDDVNIRRSVEKPKLLRRFSSRKGKAGGLSRPVSSMEGRKMTEENQQKSDSSKQQSFKSVKAKCVGILHPPYANMTMISCHISPDLSQTSILFYSLSRYTGTFCYMLHCYSNASLQESGRQAEEVDQLHPVREAISASHCKASPTQEEVTPHLIRTIKLSREVQPYFGYDPRYGFSRIAVGNYESRDEGIIHELVVLSLSAEDVRVVTRGKLSLPALFGNSRFSLLYSKDGELIILQKLTDDRFGVTSFCDIYIFNSNDLTLIKYMTASLPGLFHICKVSYEPVFSRCGSFVRTLDHRLASDVDGEESDDCITVQIYQLPRLLSLLSQCRRVILQQVSSCRCLDVLPLPVKLIDYLKFKPIYS